MSDKTNFLVSLETPGRGTYILGFLRVTNQDFRKETQRIAQTMVVEQLVASGIPLENIGRQVADYTSLEIGVHQITIVPVKEFDSKITSVLAALL